MLYYLMCYDSIKALLHFCHFSVFQNALKMELKLSTLIANQTEMNLLKGK